MVARAVNLRPEFRGLRPGRRRRGAVLALTGSTPRELRRARAFADLLTAFAELHRRG